MDPLIILKDLSQQPAYAKNVSQRVFRIAYTADDVNDKTVKQLDVSAITINGVRPQVVYVQPQIGAQLLFGFTDQLENNLTDEFTLQAGEFVTQPWAFSIPSDATTLYFMMKSLPAPDATGGEVNLTFHGGW